MQRLIKLQTGRSWGNREGGSISDDVERNSQLCPATNSSICCCVEDLVVKEGGEVFDIF